MLNLRDYQEKMVRDIDDAFQNGHHGVFAALPTGSGKTAVFCERIAQRMKAKPDTTTIIVVHTRELLDQVSERLTQYGLVNGIIQAGRNNPNPEALIQVCSILTICNRDLPFEPDEIVVDEAHRVMARSYRKLLERYPQARRLLISATPIRNDGIGFLPVATALIQGPSVAELQAQGHLVDVETVWPDKALRQRYRQATLPDNKYNRPEFREMVVEFYRRERGERFRQPMTVTFAANRRQALALREAFRRAGITSEVLTSGVPKTKRLRILEDFRLRLFENLIAVDIVSEGLDVPEIDILILARSMQSLPLYLQQVGRGMRPAPKKEGLLVMDCGWNHWRFGPVNLKREWKLADCDPVDYWTEVAKEQDGEWFRAWKRKNVSPQRSGTTLQRRRLSEERRQLIRDKHRRMYDKLQGQRKPDGTSYSRYTAFYWTKGGEREKVLALEPSFIPPDLRRKYQL